MRTPLTENELRDALRDLTSWEGHRETGIRSQRELSSFAAAIRLVDAVAAAAEELDHHPDIDIRYRKVCFTLLTHSAGAVTELDVELARRIDALVASAEA